MKLLTIAAFAAGLLAADTALATEPAPLMTVLIKPSRMSEAAGHGDVDLQITVPGMDLAAGAPLFALPAMAPGMTSPQPITDLSVTDALGAVPVTAPPGGGKPWTASRAVRGDVVVRYRLPIDNTRLSGPPINLRIDGEAFSSPGRMLVATPQVETAYRVAIRWDLSAMGAGAVGVSSYGDGDVELPAGPASRLTATMFMAGPLTREPATGGRSFSASWAGEPPFDPRPLMQWTGELHTWMTRFFKDTSEPPYRVFLRRNPQNPGGGVAMTQAFMVGYGVETTPESLKSILGHEMTHTWTASGEQMDKWYDEGNAVYYQGLLPWRAGLISTDKYLADLNRTASRYYTNPKKHTPDKEVLAQFWDDTWVRVLPYDRGALYFAVLNGKIGRASAGKRSVDDLVLAMNALRHGGQPVSEAVWVELLRREIGEAGPATHQAMMAGGLMLPESEDFGPCFRRTVHKIRQFEPGFDIKSLVGPEKVVRGLKPGTEAAKAGLRDGDRILAAPLGDALQRDVTRTVTVRVMRDGQPVSMTYLPRGEAVDAYQWERIAGIPDSACR